MATIAEIADAVVAALNAAQLSQPLEAKRYYLPEFDLQDMDALHVSVVPAELEEETADRSRDRAEYKIHVAVQKRVAQGDPPGIDQAAIDGLMTLVQEIDDLFRHKPLVGFAQASWAKTENKPIYDPKHLKEHGQFTSLLVLTFRVMGAEIDGSQTVGVMKRIATSNAIGGGGLRIKTEMFFDRQAVIEAVGRAGAKALGKAGAFIQRRAKSSIRKRKRASRPGEPPSSHVGTLRNRIYFSYDPPTRSVVVGPTPLGSVGVVPPALEYGGPTPRHRNLRRRRRILGGAGEIRLGGRAGRTTKKTREGKLVTYAKLNTSAQVDRANRLNEELYGPEFIAEGRIAARPYMGPALQKEMPSLPALWAGSVK